MKSPEIIGFSNNVCTTDNISKNRATRIEEALTLAKTVTKNDGRRSTEKNKQELLSDQIDLARNSE